MRILIIGGGNTGRNLAMKFCDERHDVVLVDNQAEVLKEVEGQIDILTIHGAGSNPRILEEAGVDKSDMIVAVTDQDEVNILACAIAQQAGVAFKIARVANHDFIRPAYFDLQKIGVDLVINQKEECANELFNILRMPGAIEVVDMLDGQVYAVGMPVHMDSPLLRAPLKAFPEAEWLNVIRFIAIMRGTELIMPRGDTLFLVGDEIYFVGKLEDIGRFMKWAWPERSSFAKIIIAGGGDTGIHLAKLLEKTDAQIVLVEENEERANYCSGVLGRTLVIKDDALDNETLDNIGIVETTAYAAVTGNDEKNIIGCMVAAKRGAHFTAAQVSKPEYVPIINNQSVLDRAVSPHLSMINSILHFVRGKNVKSAAQLTRLAGELLEVVIPERGKWTGKAIKNLKLPEGITIASALRNGEVLAATGELVFAPGDRVVVYCLPGAFKKIESMFRK